MKQAKYGLVLFILLALAPVRSLLESMMIFHMHTQMPLIVFSGFLIAPFFQQTFPNFFRKYNYTGLPGILLVILIWTYWQMPRAMDDALVYPHIELFKFISLSLLVGVPLRDSFPKLKKIYQFLFFLYLFCSLLGLGFIYIWIDEQICNNYLVIEQQTLGWSSLALSFCVLLYIAMQMFESKETKT
ncbi:hypothetical protein ACFOZ1_03835 [Gracilibacillus marinus]|jgi:hypothetical protein|uniref:Uncharacterized protein n=1 Tax=Gracilibacillus marinus TaxID=630535 RepID=A0ABV8VV50_9BACI